jgi:tripartite-type tricarboxylate transporter receptor subunit TctC
MSGKLSRCVVHVVTVAALVLAIGSASGQEYPNRIIRIVTAAAGGGSDFIARILAQGISGPLGQQIIVENRGTGVWQEKPQPKLPGMATP